MFYRRFGNCLETLAYERSGQAVGVDVAEATMSASLCQDLNPCRAPCPFRGLWRVDGAIVLSVFASLFLNG